MPAQAPSHPLPHRVFTKLHSLMQNNKHDDDLSIFLVRDAASTHIRDGVVGKETILNVEWVDVLSTADDDVFESACDGNVAFGVYGGFVAGLEIEVEVSGQRISGVVG